MFNRPVHIGLSPNASFQDAIKAFSLLFQPWIWQKGPAIKYVEQWFKDYFNIPYAISFNAGRSALLTILELNNFSKGSEVMLQAFTCLAVPNSIVWAGLKPIYVDIDKTLNFNVKDAEKKISPHTKAVIVQHTFGVPANMDEISVFCKKNDLILIEDCAHALGASYKGKLVGTFGDAAFLSFGRDKIISSVFGGMALTKKETIGTSLLEHRDKLAYPSHFWIIQQLLHPVLTMIGLYFYHVFNLGKILIYLGQLLGLLSFPVYESEKRGIRPSIFPTQLPNALATLALLQLTQLDSFNTGRRKIAKFYMKIAKREGLIFSSQIPGSVYLRFNVLTSYADEIRFRAKQKGMILGNWYKNIVDPRGIDLVKIGYELGSCPEAEKVASLSLNLPTYPNLTEAQVQEIVKIL